MKISRFVMLLLIVLGLFGAAAAQTAYQPVVEEDYCPFALPAGEVEGDTVECGYLTVPQDRDNLDERDIELAYAILYASGSRTVSDPIIYLEGGPGGSALSGLDLWVDSPFRESRDIVLLDQRGAGYSLPRLQCYELDEIDDTLDDDVYSEAEENALLECQDRFTADGIDLSDYHSAANAADVRDLAVALGYETWNLYGISYGTRLALTVMRDVPEGLRSVVLDSTYPPVVDAYEESPGNTYRVLHQLFSDCAADTACNAAYPDLENRFLALVDRLNASPALLPEDGGEFYGDDLIFTLVDYFYSTSLVPYLPLLIDEVDRGVFTTLLDIDAGDLPPVDDAAGVMDEDDPVFLFVDEFFYLVEDMDDDPYYELYDALYEAEYWEDVADILYDYLDEEDADYLAELLDEMDDDQLYALEFELFGEDVSDTSGMFDTFECSEEVPFNNYDEAAALSANIPAQIRDGELDGVQEMIDYCLRWGVPARGAIEDLAVTSSIPTLVLAGDYDPVTPPSWGEAAAASLENSYFFVFPGVGHGAIDGGDCPISMALAFLENPATAPNSDCIAGMGVQFVMP